MPDQLTIGDSDSSLEFLPRNCVDLIFALSGATVPRDHGYALYSAIAGLIPWLHEPQARRLGVAVFPIRGRNSGDGTLMLNNRNSHLRLRVPADKIPLVLPLAGKLLELDGHRLRVGVPRVAPLVPAAVLQSPLVLIKLAHAEAPEEPARDRNDDTGITTANVTCGGTRPRRAIVAPETFLDAARRQLRALRISAELTLQRNLSGTRRDQPRRRVIRVKDQVHVGYAVIVRGLTAEESIRLQEYGLGGRRMMGCGAFLPVRGRM